MLMTLYTFWSFMMFSLEKTTGKKIYVLVAMGLGLGIGLGVSLFGWPRAVSALPPTAVFSQISLKIKRIKSPELGIDVEVNDGEIQLLPLIQLAAPAVHVSNSATIGQGQAIIIQGTLSDYSFVNLDQAELGEEIFVLGSNDGWYRYRIIETRSISYDELDSLLTQPRETLVLMAVNPVQQSVTAVLARPLQ